MRIKSKDIAEALGISPATVSLVLNGRSGVNKNTRQRVLQYIDNLEQEQYNRSQGQKHTRGGTVVMLNYIKHGIILDRGAKSGNTVRSQIENAIRSEGYAYLSLQFQEQGDNLEMFLKELRNKDVKGIYLMGAEMTSSDIYPFLHLKIPIVVGDNLFYEHGIDSFLVDNREGMKQGVDYLIDKGHSHIVYLGEDLDIFNFVERREAFVQEMKKRQCGDVRNHIRHLGNSVDEVYESMKKYLDEGIRKATAFILESSVISLGVSKALLERKIRIPRDVSLLGFDALPPVSLLGIELTLIKGTHARRHLAAIKHLMRHIEDDETEVIRIYYKTRLLEGDSVFDKAKYIYHQ